jgi:hypothetical protein
VRACATDFDLTLGDLASVSVVEQGSRIAETGEQGRVIMDRPDRS